MDPKENASKRIRNSTGTRAASVAHGSFLCGLLVLVTETTSRSKNGLSWGGGGNPAPQAPMASLMYSAICSSEMSLGWSMMTTYRRLLMVRPVLPVQALSIGGAAGGAHR